MTSQSQDRDDTIEQTASHVVRIGRLWAVYGLEVGRAALRTSSETLKATSEILGSLARALDDDEGAARRAARAAKDEGGAGDQAA